MLDGLFGRGFTSKCKSSIKLIKTRIDVIRRKRNAMQKFLKNDISDLLKNSLDINAYGRAEGLLVELNLSSCYDLVEQFCVCILKHISVMQNQRECPEECKEAVQSLIFAAARFADLPELRDLRQLFSERYGNSLETFLNQEFAEKMAAKHPTREKKLQLMRDIAKEFSIKWDSKAFEQKLSNPPASVQEQSKKQGSFHDSNNGYKLHNDMEDTIPKKDVRDVSSQGRRELSHDEYKSHNVRVDIVPKKDGDQHILSNGRQEFSDDGYKVHNSRNDTILKRDNQDVPTRGRPEPTDDGYKLRNEREYTVSKKNSHDDRHKPHRNREDGVLRRDQRDISSCQRQEVSNTGYKPKKDNQDGLSYGRLEHINDVREECNGEEDSVPENENYNGNISSHAGVEVIHSFTRRQQVKTDVIDVPVAADNNQNGPKNHSHEKAESLKPFCNNVVPPPYVKPRGGKYGTNSESQGSSSENNEASSDPPYSNRDMRKRSERTEKRLDHVEYGGHHGYEKDHHRNDVVGDAKSRPRSVRRHLKPPPCHGTHDSIGNSEREEKRNLDIKKENARRGHQTSFVDDHDSEDEEEKMMDKLLLHYSKKPSTYEPSKIRGLKAPHTHDTAADTGRSPHHLNRAEAELNTGLRHPPARTFSLPPEPTTLTEVQRVARASSFQPDGQAGHVHPKLPDYDDLAARIAALTRS